MSASQPRHPADVPVAVPDDVPTLLVKIFGKDRPGITAGLFDTRAAYSVDVVDIEQVVTRGRSVRGALV
ncbi:ACT domain-containing protein, partial [Streptomyces sp. NPDC056728]